ncbi:MAG: type II toxin-antitoxin system RelE/ParE family toxin [Terracidiphilus sp.]|nr:type II toxin-antitoxin system RelE/ParE family toxin [Terracidiphilus sp.]
MTNYSIAFKASAEKELLQLPASVVSRLLPRIEALALEPHPTGSKKLRGAKDLWRIRSGKYRAIYSIDDNRRQIVVMRVAHRSEVYN